MDKYLQQILQEINTIIIPGLGALTITNKASGEIMFMSFLKHDDGNLSKYISEKENLSENDSKNMISKYVREIQSKLDIGDTYDMYQFGRFVKKNGEIEFENRNSYQGSEIPQATAETPVQSPVETPIVTLVPEIKEEEKPVVEEKIVVEEKAPEEKIEKPVEEEDKSALAGVNEMLEDLIEASTPIHLEEKVEEKKEDVKLNVSEIKPDENVYIPAEEVKEISAKQSTAPVSPKVAPAKPVQKANAVKKPASTAEKKKKSPMFWVLVVLGFLIVAGGAGTAIFYDQVKSFISGEKTEVKPLAKEEAAPSDEELEKAEEQVSLEAENEATENATDVKTETENIPETEVKETVKEEKATSTLPVSDGSLSYHIIAGSFTSDANADRLAKKYQAEGKNSRVLGKFDKFYMVSYESFATQQEANTAMKSSPLAGKAWVFKYPK